MRKRTILFLIVLAVGLYREGPVGGIVAAAFYGAIIYGIGWVIDKQRSYTRGFNDG